MLQATFVLKKQLLFLLFSFTTLIGYSQRQEVNYIDSLALDIEDSLSQYKAVFVKRHLNGQIHKTETFYKDSISKELRKVICKELTGRKWTHHYYFKNGSLIKVHLEMDRTEDALEVQDCYFKNKRLIFQMGDNAFLKPKEMLLNADFYLITTFQ